MDNLTNPIQSANILDFKINHEFLKSADPIPNHNIVHKDVIGTRLTPHNPISDKIKSYINAPSAFISDANPNILYTNAAHSQSRTGLALKSGAQLLGEIVGGLVEVSGAMLNPETWSNLWDDSPENFKTNMIQDIGKFMNQGIKDALPIYLTEEAQKGFALTDKTWIASMFPSVGSALSVLVPVAGAVRGVAMLGKLAKLKVGKTVGKILSTTSSGVLSTHIDSFREAQGTFNQQYEHLKSLGYNEEESRKYASDMASNAYRYGYANLAFNILQWTLLIKPTSLLERGINTKVLAAMLKKEGLDEALETTAKSTLRKNMIGLAGDVSQLMVTEALEEMIIDFAQKEGIRTTRVNNGLLEDNTVFVERIGEYLQDRHVWDSGLWGAIGGLFMSGGRGAINKIMYGKQHTANAEKTAKEIIDRADEIRKNLSNLSKYIQKEDETSAKLLINEMVSDIIFSSAKTGSLDLYSEMLDNLASLSDEQLKAVGLTKDIVNNIGTIKQQLKESKTLFDTYINKQINPLLTEEENNLIGILIAKHHFSINNINQIIKALEDKKLTEDQTIKKLQELLNVSDSKDIINNLLSSDNETRKKAISKLFNSDIARTYVEFFKAHSETHEELGRLVAEKKMYLYQNAIIDKSLESYIDNEASGPLSAQYNKEAKIRKQNDLRAKKNIEKLLKDIEEKINKKTKQLEDIEAEMKVLEEGENKEEIINTRNTISTILGFTNNAINKEIAHLKMIKGDRQTELHKLLDSKKQIDFIKTLKKEYEEEYAQRVKDVKNDINASETIEELDKIVKDNPDLKNEISSLVNSRKDDIKKKEVLEKERVKQEDSNNKSQNTPSNTPSNAPSNTPSNAPSNTPSNTPSNLSVNTPGNVSDNTSANTSQSNVTATTSSAPLIKYMSTEELLKNKNSAIKFIQGLSFSLNRLKGLHLSQSVNKETEELFNQFKKEAIYISSRLDAIIPKLHESELSSEELMEIGETVILVNEFSQVLDMIMKIQDVKFSMTIDAELRQSLDLYRTFINAFYTSVEGFSNYNISLTAKDSERLLRLKIAASEFDRVINANTLMNQVRIIRERMGLESSDIRTDINSLQAAIADYIKFVLNENPVNVSFEQVADAIFKKIPDRQSYIKLMNIVKNLYNLMNETNQVDGRFDTSSKIDIDINDDYFKSVMLRNNNSKLFIEVPYTIGAYMNIDIFGDEEVLSLAESLSDENTQDLSPIHKAALIHYRLKHASTPEVAKKVRLLMSLKTNDKVELRMEDGKMQLYKDGNPLGVYMANPGEVNGIKYVNEKGEFQSVAQYLTQEDFVFIISNLDEFMNFHYMGSKKIKDTPNTNLVKQKIFEIINRVQKVEKIEDMTDAQISHIIAPIFYGLHQSHKDKFKNIITLDRLRNNYMRMHNKMKSDFNHKNKYATKFKEGATSIPMRISSLSIGERVYLNYTEYGGNGPGNLNDRVASTSGKFRIGFTADVHNKTNRIVYDAETGEPMDAHNAIDIRDNLGFSNYQFFVQHETNGIPYLSAITTSKLYNSPHNKDREYSSKVSKHIWGIIREFLELENPTNEQAVEYKNKVSKWLAVTRPGQDNDIFKFVIYKKNNKITGWGVIFQATSDKGTNIHSLINNVEEITYTIKPLDENKSNIVKYGDTIDEFQSSIRTALLNTQRGVLLKFDSGKPSLDLSHVKNGKVYDEVTGETYNGYIDFLISTGALSTTMDGVRDMSQPDTPIITNFNPIGKPKMSIFVEEYEPSKISNETKQRKKEIKEKSKSTKKVVKQVTKNNKTIELTSTSPLSEFNGAEMTIETFSELMKDDLAFMPEFKFLLDISNVLFGSSIKIVTKFETQTETNAHAAYDSATSTITIYKDFISTSRDNRLRTKEERSLIIAHELLHDILTGIKEASKTSEYNLEVFQEVVEEINKFLIRLEEQLTKEDVIFKDPITNLELSARQVILGPGGYMDKIRAAKEEGWQEVITFALTNPTVAAALNSINTVKRGTKTTFFKNLMSIVIKFINIINNTLGFKVNEKGALNELVNIIQDLSAIYQNVADSNITVTRPKFTLNSSDIQNNNSENILNAYNNKKITPIQLELFANDYNNNIEQVKEEVLQSSSIIAPNQKDYDDIPFEEINGRKTITEYYESSLSTYKSKFPNAKIIHFKHRNRDIYKMVVVNPSISLESSDIESVHNMPIPGHKFTPFEIENSQKILTRFYIDNREKYGDPTIEDFRVHRRTIKSDIITALEDVLNSNTSKQINRYYINKILEDLKESDSEIFHYFKMYMSKYFNAEILDITWENESEDGISLDNYLLSKSWDENSQSLINPLDNANIKVKYEIAKLSRTSNTYSGLTEALNISDVWFELHSNLSNLPTEEDIIIALKKLGSIAGKSHFADLVTLLEQEDEASKNFRSAFMIVFNKSLQSYHCITFSNKGEKTVIDFALQNRYSFGYYSLFDEWFNNIIYRYESEALNNVPALYDNVIFKLATLLGENISQIREKIPFLKLLSQERTKNELNKLNKEYENLSDSERQSKRGEEIEERINQLHKERKANNPKKIPTPYNLHSYANDIDRNTLNQIAVELGFGSIEGFTDEDVKNIARPLIHVLESVMKMIVFKNNKFDSRKYLTDIAKTYVKYGTSPTDFSFLNSNGDSEFGLSQPFFISSFFKGILKTDNFNSDSSEYKERLLNKFKDAIVDVRMAYSNWLWHKEGNGNPNAIFTYNTEGSDRNVARVNSKFFSDNFDFTFFDGIKFIEEHYGMKADKITNNIWDLINIIAFLNGDYNKDGIQTSAWMMLDASDSPRAPMLKVPLYNVVSNINPDGRINRDSEAFNAMYNIMLQDLFEMYVARDTIFDIKKEGKIGIGLIPKPQFDDNNKDNKLHTLHRVKHGKVKDGKLVLLEDGMPIGRVFKFLSLTYIENGKVITFEDFLKNHRSFKNVANYSDFHLLYDSFEEALQDTKFTNAMKEFIDITVEHATKKALNRFKSIEKQLNNLHKRKTLDKRNSVPLLPEQIPFENIVKSFIVNNTIFKVEVANLFGGTPSEYTGAENYNQRIGQYIKPGDAPLYNEIVRTLVVDDIYLSSPEVEEIRKYIGHHADKYNDINTTDGFSVITINHYKKRLRAWGKYDEYKDIIEALENPDYTMNPTEFKRYIESLKFFYYDRQLKGREFKGDANAKDTGTYAYMYSTQIKNSTVVLAPGLYKSTQLNELYYKMIENGIDEIDFSSSVKVSDVMPISINDGYNLKFPDYDTVQSRIRIKNLENYRLQLEIKPHILDEVIKLGVQISKNIFNSLDMNHDYNINGNSVKGRDLFIKINKMISANIESSALELLNSWGAIRNGKILHDEHGNILVDTRKIDKYLRSYIEREGLDINMNRATEEVDGRTRMPLYAPIHYKKLTSIILSKFTKKVVDQKMPGIHAPIIPNLFMNKSNIVGQDSIVGQYMKEHGSIQYLDEIHERGDYRLRYNKKYNDKGQLIHEVEVVINPWISSMIKYGDVIDINKLDSDVLKMLGIRIPTEGKQSMIVAKVVGFMNNGATVAMFPDELIVKTGWDFDIDSVYLYYKNLKVTYDKYEIKDIKVINYLDDSRDDERFELWMKEQEDLYNNIIEEIQEENPNNPIEQLESLYDRLGLINEEIHHVNKDNELIKLEQHIIDNTLNNYIPNRVIDRFKNEDKFIDYERLYQLRKDIILTIQEVYNPMINELNEDKYHKQLTRLGENKLNSLMNERAKLLKTVVYLNDIKKKYEELYKLYELETLPKLNELKDSKKAIRAEINKIKSSISSDINLFFRNEYNSLTEEQKNTRKARENNILSMYEAILKDEVHASELSMPNDMDESIQSAKFINTISNVDTSGLNMNFYADAATIRDINMAIRQLKANSVAMDGMMAVLGITNAYLKSGITFIFTPEQLNNITDIDKLEEVFGKGNIEKVGNNFKITARHLNNNASNKWTDIFGYNIPHQASQTTSHILDAVKKLMGFNINEYTLGVYKLLSYTAFNVVYNGSSNKYIFPNLVLHQPIIVDYVKECIITSLDSFVSPDDIIKTIKINYILNIINDAEFESYIDSYIDSKIGVDGIKREKDTLRRQFNSIILKANKDKLSNKDLVLVEDIATFISSKDERDSISKMIEGIVNNADKKYSILYYANQLAHLEHFRVLNHKAQAVIGLVSTLNMDKKKLGPSPSDTRIIMDKVTQYNESAKLELEEQGDEANVILVDNVPILEAILPSAFNKVAESIYPMFESYYNYGAKLAQSVMGTISPFETPQFKEVKDIILNNYKNYKSKIEVDNLLNVFALTYYLELPNILSVETLDQVPTIETKIALIKRVNGMFATWEENNISIEELTNGRTHLLPEDFEKFSKLSLTNKIRILRTSTNHSPIINDEKIYKGSHILKIIRLNENRSYFEEHGKTNIYVARIDINKNMAIHSTEQMFYHGDVFMKNTIIDLIRHTFYNHGLNFGDNISKFISVNILSDGNEIFGQYSNSLYDLGQHLESINESDFINDFYISNANNPKIVPVYTPSEYNSLSKKILRWQGLYDLESNTKIVFTVDNLEDIESLHRISNSPYIIRSYGENNILLKRFDIEYNKNSYVVHIAMAKRNIYERDFTIIPSNKNIKKIITQNGNILIDVVLPELHEVNNYLNIILQSDLFKSLADESIKPISTQSTLESSDITVHNSSSQIQAYKDLTKDYNTVIYLGETQGLEYNMFNDQYPLEFIRFITANDAFSKIKSKVGKSKVAIIGNLDLDSHKVSELRKLIKLIDTYNPTLESIGTISNSNVSFIIQRLSQNHIDVYTSNKDVPNHILYSEDISTSDKISLSAQGTILKTMINNSNILAKRYKQTGTNFAEAISNIMYQFNKDDIYSQLDKAKINSLLNGATNQIKIFTLLQPYIIELSDILSSINFEKWNDYSESDKMVFIYRMKEAADIIQMAEVANDLTTLENEIDIKDSVHNEEILKSYMLYNKSLDKLKELTNSIQSSKLKVMNTIKKYMGTIIYENSRNPKYNTRFKEQGLDMTSDQLYENVTKMLTQNEDLNFYMSWLDSMFNTGITIIDNIMTEYIILQGEQRRNNIKYRDELAKLIAALYGDKYLLNPEEVKQGKPPKYNLAEVTSSKNASDRTILFKISLFDESTGGTISKYDWSRFYKERNKIWEDTVEKVHQDYQEGIITKQQYKKKLRNAYKKLQEWEDDNVIPYNERDSILTQEELDTINANKKLLSEKLFEKWMKSNNYKLKSVYDKKLKRNINLGYYKYTPSDKYLNPKYDKLSKAEKDLLFFINNVSREILQDVYNEYGIKQNFFPIVMYQDLNSALKQLVGYLDIEETRLETGINNELYKIEEAPMTRYVEYEPIYEIGYMYAHETEEEYEEKVLNSVNKLRGRDSKFKTVDEIKKYNKAAYERNKKRTIEHMSKDPLLAMNMFIGKALEYKKVKDFNIITNLLIGVIKSSDFKLQSKVRGKKLRVSGKDSNAVKRLESFLSTLSSDSKIRNKIEQSLNVLKQQTSLTYMAFNITGGIKNVLTGYLNMIQESAANEFLSNSDLRWATNQYLKSSLDLISDFGSDYSDNKDVAIMKRFINLLDLKNEQGFERNPDDNNVHRILMATEMAYFMNNVTEHFMQYTMLLGMLRSHRVVNGTFMSITEYINNSRLDVLKEILPKDKIKLLEAYINKGEKHNTKYSDNRDYIYAWINGKTNGVENMTAEERIKYTDRMLGNKAKGIKSIEKERIESFNKFETLYDNIEVKDGRAVLKEGSTLTEKQLDLFERRVHQVNHSLHGIYNRIDRNRIKNNIMGDLVLQFRSWMRPNWNRYWGMRFGRSIFNEALGSYRKGAFISLGKYISHPIVDNIRLWHDKDVTIAEALKNIIAGYVKFLFNARAKWAELDIRERQNIRRATANLVNIATLALLTTAIGLLMDDDEEEAYAVAFLAYQLNATFTEVSEFVPVIGWAGTLTRTKQYTMASERVIFEYINILSLIAKYPFQDERAREYSKGIYKDQDKLKVAILKNTPILRQYHKMSYIPQYTSWYKLYNPLYNIIPDIKK